MKGEIKFPFREKLGFTFPKREQIPLKFPYSEGFETLFPYLEKVSMEFPYRASLMFTVPVRPFTVARETAPGELNMYLIHNNLNLASGLIPALDPCYLWQLDDFMIGEIDSIPFDY